MAISNEARNRLELIRANSKTLQECELHDFDLQNRETGRSRVTCKNCGAHTDFFAAHMYHVGLEHGKQTLIK